MATTLLVAIGSRCLHRVCPRTLTIRSNSCHHPLNQSRGPTMTRDCERWYLSPSSRRREPPVPVKSMSIRCWFCRATSTRRSLSRSFMRGSVQPFVVIARGRYWRYIGLASAYRWFLRMSPLGLFQDIGVNTMPNPKRFGASSENTSAVDESTGLKQYAKYGVYIDYFK